MHGGVTAMYEQPSKGYQPQSIYEEIASEMQAARGPRVRGEAGGFGEKGTRRSDASKQL